MQHHWHSTELQVQGSRLVNKVRTCFFLNLFPVETSLPGFLLPKPCFFLLYQTVITWRLSYNIIVHIPSLLFGDRPSLPPQHRRLEIVTILSGKIVNINPNSGFWAPIYSCSFYFQGLTAFIIGTIRKSSQSY